MSESNEHSELAVGQVWQVTRPKYRSVAVYKIVQLPPKAGSIIMHKVPGSGPGISRFTPTNSNIFKRSSPGTNEWWTLIDDDLILQYNAIFGKYEGNDV